MVKIYRHYLKPKLFYVQMSGEITLDDVEFIKDRFMLDYCHDTEIIYIQEFMTDSVITDSNVMKKSSYYAKLLKPRFKESVTVGMSSIQRLIYRIFITLTPQTVQNRLLFKSRADLEAHYRISVPADFELILSN